MFSVPYDKCYRDSPSHKESVLHPSATDPRVNFARCSAMVCAEWSVKGAMHEMSLSNSLNQLESQTLALRPTITPILVSEEQEKIAVEIRNDCSSLACTTPHRMSLRIGTLINIPYLMVCENMWNLRYIWTNEKKMRNQQSITSVTNGKECGINLWFGTQCKLRKDFGSLVSSPSWLQPVILRSIIESVWRANAVCRIPRSCKAKTVQFWGTLTCKVTERSCPGCTSGSSFYFYRNRRLRLDHVKDSRCSWMFSLDHTSR